MVPSSLTLNFCLGTSVRRWTSVHMWTRVCLRRTAKFGKHSTEFGERSAEFFWWNVGEHRWTNGKHGRICLCLRELTRQTKVRWLKCHSHWWSLHVLPYFTVSILEYLAMVSTQQEFTTEFLRNGQDSSSWILPICFSQVWNQDKLDISYAWFCIIYIFHSGRQIENHDKFHPQSAETIKNYLPLSQAYCRPHFVNNLELMVLLKKDKKYS